jgi:hypothetical protein
LQPTTHVIDRRSTFDVVAMQKIKALKTSGSSGKSAIGSPSTKHGGMGGAGGGGSGVGTVVEEEDRRTNTTLRILS